MRSCKRHATASLKTLTVETLKGRLSIGKPTKAKPSRGRAHPYSVAAHR
jgi:hypothetical protein